MTARAESKTISYEDFLRVEGLLVIAADHRREMKALTKALAGVVGEEADEHGYYGHVDDVIWSDGDRAIDLLRRLGIEVEPADGVELGCIWVRKTL